MSSAEYWIVASTLIFILLVAKPASKAIAGGLDGRRAGIVNELEEAHRLRIEAEALLEEARNRHQSAAKSAEEIISFARDEAARLRITSEAEMKDHVARREKQALDRIAQAESTALAAIRNSAVDLALAASSEILTQKMSGAQGDRLIDDLIATLPRKLAGGAR